MLDEHWNHGCYVNIQLQFGDFLANSFGKLKGFKKDFPAKIKQFSDICFMYYKCFIEMDFVQVPKKQRSVHLE